MGRRSRKGTAEIDVRRTGRSDTFIKGERVVEVRFEPMSKLSNGSPMFRMVPRILLQAVLVDSRTKLLPELAIERWTIWW